MTIWISAIILKTFAQTWTNSQDFFYRLRLILTVKQLLLTYKGYIQPVASHGVLVYGTTNKTNFFELLKKSIKILRADCQIDCLKNVITRKEIDTLQAKSNLKLQTKSAA